MNFTLTAAALSLPNLVGRLPGGVAQGIIWGIMALGVYITFRLLDVADLTVDGSFTTGGAVTVMLILAGCPAWVALLVALCAGILAGLITGLLHTKLGIPAILAGILTQFALYSINLHIMGMSANKPVNPDRYRLLLTARSVPIAILVGAVIAGVIIAVLYWYFGTEQGSAIRSTGSNPAMSRAQGSNINNMKVLGLSISNGLVALSGGLMSQYQGFADDDFALSAVVGVSCIDVIDALIDCVPYQVDSVLLVYFQILVRLKSHDPKSEKRRFYVKTVEFFFYHFDSSIMMLYCNYDNTYRRFIKKTGRVSR